ncbi:MAG: acyl carrier protein [Gemmatimonadota bacterium]
MTPPEAVIARVFGVSADRVTDQTSNETLPEWDSLGHITLVIELEATYAVSLSAEETLTLTSVAAIKRLLEERGITW